MTLGVPEEIIKKNTLTPVQQQPQAPTLSAPKPPTSTLQQGPALSTPGAGGLSPFVKEAQKLGLDAFEAARKISDRDIKEDADVFNRQLFGRNVGPGSNQGQDALQRTLVQRNRELEPVARQVATDIGLRGLDHSQTNVDRNIDLIMSGVLRPDENLSARLEANGVSGELISRDQAQILSQFGRREDGTIFGSKEEALAYWDGKNFETDVLQKFGTDSKGNPFTSLRHAERVLTQEGFESDLIRDYGIDPDTGKPFLSREEAVNKVALRYNLDENQQAIAVEYGTRADGTPFNSISEAQTYWKAEELKTLFGSRDDGTRFTSKQEALEYWDTRGFKKNLVEKYGVSESGSPFSNEASALDYWERQGADRELTKKYGLRDDGTPFKSLQDALDTQESRELAKRVETLPPGIKETVTTLDELNHYLETGKTYEDDIEDILRDKKSLEQWNASLPKLEGLLQKWNKKVELEAKRQGGKVFKNKAKLRNLESQKAAIEQTISEIRAGVVPIVEQEFIRETFEEGALR